MGVRWDWAELAVTPKELMSPARLTLSRGTAAQSPCGIYGDQYAISAQTQRNRIFYYLLCIIKDVHHSRYHLTERMTSSTLVQKDLLSNVPPSSWLQPPSLQTPTKEMGLWGMPLRLPMWWSSRQLPILTHTEIVTPLHTTPGFGFSLGSCPIVQLTPAGSLPRWGLGCCGGLLKSCFIPSRKDPHYSSSFTAGRH